MILEKNDSLLIIGDSITDCGRGREVIDGISPSLGNGYAAMLAETIYSRYPELNINVINKGVSGNTTRNLKSRWENDVLALSPDWLCIMIGINDVWRSFDQPGNPDAGVSLTEYEANMEELIRSAGEAVKKGILLATPYFIESNRQDKMRAKMDQFGAVVKKLAEKHSLLLVDTQAPFDKTLETKYPMYFCNDRVHPNAKGHALLAKAILDIIEER